MPAVWLVQDQQHQHWTLLQQQRFLHCCYWRLLLLQVLKLLRLVAQRQGLVPHSGSRTPAQHSTTAVSTHSPGGKQQAQVKAYSLHIATKRLGYSAGAACRNPDMIL
jgi:hypothetical protein